MSVLNKLKLHRMTLILKVIVIKLSVITIVTTLILKVIAIKLSSL